MRQFYTLIFTCLLAAPAATLAQPASSEEPPAVDSAAQARPAATAPAPEPSEKNDPFDYEASEEISEDLSVSFPVDI